MLKSSSQAAIIFLLGTLTLAGVACSRESNAHRSSTLPIATETPSAAPIKVSAAPPNKLEAQEVTELHPDYFELALDKAYSAFTIRQSAQSPDDWRLVVILWQEAIALMKAVPASSPQKVIAQKKIAEYQENITHAQQQYTRPIKNNDPLVAVVPVAPPVSTPPDETPSSMQLQQVFQVPIKRRASGTPVIEVTFNGIQQFDMIVDTGASGTVITQQTAAALRVLPVGKAKANTASDTVEFSIGYVDSIEVGGVMLLDALVAIAPSPKLETGLLGHDFFSNYDVTIKRDVVEFRPQ